MQSKIIIAVMAAGIEAVARTMAAEAGYNNLKQEQVQAVVEFIRGRDVFVSLPTGYGKSLIYGSLPEVIKRVQGQPQKTSIALVISPLLALLLDWKGTLRSQSSTNGPNYTLPISYQHLAINVITRCQPITALGSLHDLGVG